MRDDRYPFTRAERADALAAWRRVNPQDRREACRRAKRGLAAPDSASSAARRYGEYLLQRNLSNRVPRSALPLAGVLFALVGAVAGVGVVAVPGGLVVAALGVLAWTQRRCGRRLVAANGTPASVDPGST